MLDLNQVRADFAAYLAGNASRRHSLDAALMHVVQAAYQKGMNDAVQVPAVLLEPIPDLDPIVAAGNGGANSAELAAARTTGVSEDAGGAGQGAGSEAGNPAPAQPAPAMKGGALARLAGMWCNDAGFQRWLKGKMPGLLASHAARAQTGNSDHLIAGNVIRALVGVKTRAELDHNATAASVFNRLIRGPYAEHLKQ